MAFVRNNNNNNNNNRRHNNNYSNNRHRHPNHTTNAGQGTQNGQRRHVNRVNQVFESNGPEGRIRGTAAQIVEKYITMSRDVGMSGDRVLSQNYLQHAEHYQRLLNEITEENAIFEKEREAIRQAQQAQPDLSPEMAAEGFVASEAVADQADQQAQPTQRAERPERAERPQQQRQPRPDREDRPQRERERRPADDVPDNELPSFLHVPIKEGKPATEATKPATEPAPTAAPRRVAAPRPRRVAPTAQSDEETGQSIQAGPSDDQ